MKDDHSQFSENQFSLEQLCALVELPKRTVRYYIQEDMVDRPVGGGRSAYYTRRHLEQLIAIKRWQKAGLSLERIGQLLRQDDEEPLPPPAPRAGTVEVWSHLIIDDGVELHIEPGQSGLKPEQVKQLLKAVRQQLEFIRGDKT